MRLCVTTFYNPQYSLMGEICSLRLQQYAEKHGFDFRLFRHSWSDRPAAWNKIRVIEELFSDGYDYVLWVDADTLPLNLDADIRDHLHTESDWYLVRHFRHGGEVPNTGVMAVRNCDAVRQALRDIWNAEAYISSAWWENGAWIDYAGLRSRVPAQLLTFMPTENYFDTSRTAPMRITWLPAQWNCTAASPLLPDPVILHFAGVPTRTRTEHLLLKLLCHLPLVFLQMLPRIWKTNRLRLIRFCAGHLPAYLRFTLKSLMLRIKSRISALERVKTRLIGLKLRCTTSPRILIDLSRSGLGNGIAITPMMAALKELYPTAQIDLMTRSPEAFNTWDRIHRCFPPEEQITDLPYTLTLKIRYIYSLQTFFSLNTILLVPPFDSSEQLYFMDWVRLLGYRGTSPSLHIDISAEILPRIPQTVRIGIADCGGDQNAGLLGESKRWKYFDQLIENLLQHDEVHLFLLGDLKDRRSTWSSPRIHDARGTLTIPQSAALIASCDLVIGNECGPMHIADAAGTPGIIIWGPTSPLKNTYGRHISMITLGLSCQPCQGRVRRFRCTSGECLNALEIELVLEEIRRRLPCLSSPASHNPSDLPTSTDRSFLFPVLHEDSCPS